MEQEYADLIQTLSRQYYDHEISQQEYRAKRKLLVDRMDNEFNGEDSLKVIGHVMDATKSTQ